MSEAIPAQRLGAPMIDGRAHDVLLVALIALRPLIWSGDATAWDNLGWLALVLIALGWLVVDAWRGRVACWRGGIAGVSAALLLCILLPAALRSVYPSTSMGVWGMAMIHLGFAAYLMQVVPGRERLAFVTLLGALAVEGVVALGQWVWVLPGMTNALKTGDPTVTGLENAAGDLANRVAYGGLFGTFTLANTLAAFLLLSAVPLVGVLRRAHGQARLIAVALVALAAVVAVGAASKGAAAALVLAGTVVWTIHRTDRLRWLGPAALAVGMILLAVVPQIRGLGASSAQVRLGYWQSASALVAERPLLGHGLHGYAAHGTRTMPPDGEPSQHVHNEVLEATVDGGVLAGLAMAGFLLLVARRRRALADEPSNAMTPEAVWRATWPLLVIVPFFSALGMLASNLEWWPAGAGEMTWWIWPLVLSGVLIGVAMVSVRLPLPPAWAWQLALAAFALHCLVDFNLQSPGLWGTLVVVCILAGGNAFAVGVCNISRTVVTMLVLSLLIGFTYGITRLTPLVDANRLVEQVENAEPELRTRFVTIAPAVEQIAARWPADRALMLAIVRAMPPGGERLPFSQRLAERQPWNGAALELLAADTAHSGAWSDALTAMRQAVHNNPAYLPRRQRLIDLLVHAARALPSQAPSLIAEAERESQRLAELAPVVHPRNRLPQSTESALPVQPTP
jgi:O-antigen ligase